MALAGCGVVVSPSEVVSKWRKYFRGHIQEMGVLRVQSAVLFPGRTSSRAKKIGPHEPSGLAKGFKVPNGLRVPYGFRVDPDQSHACERKRNAGMPEKVANFGCRIPCVY